MVLQIMKMLMSTWAVTKHGRQKNSTNYYIEIWCSMADWECLSTVFDFELDIDYINTSNTLSWPSMGSSIAFFQCL